MRERPPKTSLKNIGDMTDPCGVPVLPSVCYSNLMPPATRRSLPSERKSYVVIDPFAEDQTQDLGQDRLMGDSIECSLEVESEGCFGVAGLVKDFML